ncbi:MAG: hypothetical protein K2P59_16455 [Acetatifactor sp.]|nr:hypothetical protein [Acetatifactor sp.]
MSGKQQWVEKVTGFAKLRMSPETFKTVIHKAILEYEKKEKQGVPEEVILEQWEAPKEFVDKVEDRQGWRRLLAVLYIVFICAYFYLWIRGWKYDMKMIKLFLLCAGTFLLPEIYGFLCGRIYYGISAGILKKNPANRKFKMMDVCPVMLLVVFGIIVFPSGICSNLFNVFFYEIFMLFFLLFAVLQMLYGMRRITHMKTEDFRYVYMGNGMLHSFFSLYWWNDMVYGRSELILLLGLLIVPVPYFIDVLLFMVKQKREHILEGDETDGNSQGKRA